MPVLNETFYKNLDAKIDTIPSREEAEEFIKQAFKPIEKQLADLMDNIWTPIETKINVLVAEVQVILAVLNLPTSPDDVVTWAKSVADAYTAMLNTMKAELKPYLKQYNTMAETLNGFPSEIVKLQEHLQEKSIEKGWNIVIPTIPIPDVPPLPPLPAQLVDKEK